jgi:hypothetical protein
LSPRRSLAVEVAEAAALGYLLDPQARYLTVAAAVGCAWVTVWRWVGWIATVATPAGLQARTARLGAPTGELPRTVPAAGRARSAARAVTVVRAAQVLVALVGLHRAQPEPPVDPSPLRWFLRAAFPAGPPPGGRGHGDLSPALNNVPRGGARYTAPHEEDSAGGRRPGRPPPSARPVPPRDHRRARH